MRDFSHPYTMDFRQHGVFSRKKAPPENRRGLGISKSEAYLEASSTMATEMRQISSSSSVGMTATFTRLSSVEM